MKFLSFLCTKWMENCEAMTSWTHSFAYSYRLVKKCFLKICETSKCHNFLIFQPIFIRFSLFCSRIFTLSSEIKLNLVWISSLSTYSIRCIKRWQRMKVGRSHNRCLPHFNPNQTGGGWNPSPLDVSRDNFAEYFFRAPRFRDFFLSSLAQLLALFS